MKLFGLLRDHLCTEKSAFVVVDEGGQVEEGRVGMNEDGHGEEKEGIPDNLRTILVACHLIWKQALAPASIGHSRGYS